MHQAKNGKYWSLTVCLRTMAHISTTDQCNTNVRPKVNLREFGKSAYMATVTSWPWVERTRANWFSFVMVVSRNRRLYGTSLGLPLDDPLVWRINTTSEAEWLTGSGGRTTFVTSRSEIWTAEWVGTGHPERSTSNDGSQTKAWASAFCNSSKIKIGLVRRELSIWGM